MALMRRLRWLVAAAAVAAITAGSSPVAGDEPEKTRLIGSDHIVSWAPLPDETGALCPMPQPSFLGPRGGAAAPQAVTSYSQPDRVIRDRYPAFSSIALDLARDQIVVTDENLFQVLFYDRTENNGPGEVATPQRIIGAPWDESMMNREEPRTKIEFQCNLYVDPSNGDVYAVNNDTEDHLVIFSNEQQGNVAPSREIHTPHGTFGITVDEEAQEVFLSVQHDSAVVVYRKGASGEEPPLRLIQGVRSRLADPHGIALDARRGLLYVTNHGSVHETGEDAGDMMTPERRAQLLQRVNWPLTRDFALPGSGQTLPPSITVYEKTASGDAAPVRVIEGPRTRLNWPTGIAIDPDNGDIYVANDTTHSILVFDADASGDVAPSRVIIGSNTGLQNPTGLVLDKEHGEMWIANFGNHTATAFRLTAEGNVAPLRTIRAAPEGTPSLMIGNPGAVAYDTRRDEILAPN